MASYLYGVMALIAILGAAGAALGYFGMVNPTVPSGYLRHLEACVLGLLILALAASYALISINP